MIGRASPGAGVDLLTAFAVSTQGLSALVSRLEGREVLPPVRDFLEEEAGRAAARAERLRDWLRQAVSRLRGGGVEVVAVKGAALAFFHYEEPSLRPMGDLDLLLREPRDLERATAALVGAGWIALFDTPRHRVFARPDERVASPATEHPDNPIRLEIHTSFRLPVLGRFLDASAELRRHAETRDLGGVPIAIAAGPALLRHLLFHAAEDFAGNGIRGIQAHDFRLLARTRGALALEISSNEKERDAAPLLFAADAVERLFPNTFEELFQSSLADRVPADLRAAAARLPSLRYTRPSRGWTRTLLTLIEGPLPKARFFARTVFPGLGEVRANVAPGASGVGLVAAWVRVLARRVGAALRVRA